jgi:hypothetical protein
MFCNDIFYWSAVYLVLVEYVLPYQFEIMPSRAVSLYECYISGLREYLVLDDVG